MQTSHLPLFSYMFLNVCTSAITTNLFLPLCLAFHISSLVSSRVFLFLFAFPESRVPYSCGFPFFFYRRCLDLGRGVGELGADGGFGGVGGGRLRMAGLGQQKAVIFGPDDTPWEGGTFKLLLEFSEDYPNKPPSVRFLTRM